MRVALWLTTVALLFSLTVASGPGTAAEDSFAPLKRFSQVLDLVESHYVKDISRKELMEDAIKGMLQQLDPHSTYLSPDDFKEMQESTSGEFSGIGIEISMENGRLIVVTPIDNTPAHKAGLKAGDLILEIDGQPTQDMTLVEAVKKIRGPKGTSVRLTILHKDAGKPVEVGIVRGAIPIISAKGEQLETGVLYLRLTRFNENTTHEMRDILDAQAKKGPIKGIVLDLRNNPGGLLDQAVSVADAFLDDGLIVYIQGRDKALRKDFNARRTGSPITAPMVVLINAGSASASEIVAGALQDHKRALLLGERSFGKGSVQTVIPMSDGSGIKLTTALYYTPSGRSIQAEGIVPDLEYPFIPPVKENEDEAKRRVLREKDLSGHLENQSARDKAKDGTEGPAAEMLSKDNQLRLALELVKQLPRLREIK